MMVLSNEIGSLRFAIVDERIADGVGHQNARDCPNHACNCQEPQGDTSSLHGRLTNHELSGRRAQRGCPLERRVRRRAQTLPTGARWLATTRRLSDTARLERLLE